MTIQACFGGANVWLLCAVVGLFQEESALERYARRGVHMGVEFEVVLYAADEGQAEKAMAAAMERIAELDKALSDYDLDSELSRLSASSGAASGARGEARAMRVSEDLWRVLAE